MVHATWSVIESEKDKTNHLHELEQSPFCRWNSKTKLHLKSWITGSNSNPTRPGQGPLRNPGSLRPGAQRYRPENRNNTGWSTFEWASLSKRIPTLLQNVIAKASLQNTPFGKPLEVGFNAGGQNAPLRVTFKHLLVVGRLLGCSCCCSGAWCARKVSQTKKRRGAWGEERSACPQNKHLEDWSCDLFFKVPLKLKLAR